MSTPPTSAASATLPPRSAVSYGIAFTLMLAGLALAGYALDAVFSVDSVNEVPDVVLLTEPAELAARSAEAAGTYATGSQPGDRVITVTADGRISFRALGTKDVFANNSDTFQLARQDRKFCLLTAGSGLVEIANPDTLVYCRDTYRRTQ
ncbi:MAG: hypothetical protein NTV51_05325 [Verrucomicrobia bacterium]|nr:hypothetical protein [Verrucomicrobiota bacterium]